MLPGVVLPPGHTSLPYCTKMVADHENDTLGFYDLVNGDGSNNDLKVRLPPRCRLPNVRGMLYISTPLAP